jgi:hypothetical protein
LHVGSGRLVTLLLGNNAQAFCLIEIRLLAVAERNPPLTIAPGRAS